MNSIRLIVPYRYEGMWVFDDPAVGLLREPFVCGANTIIDRMVEDIPNADQGFRLVFSDREFPGFTDRLEWRREENGGSWYYSSRANLEGWLCPALFKYFDIAPRVIYARAEARSGLRS